MSVLVLDQVSRWFGNVVAVNDVTMRIGPGVTGLLGPNGAGKSVLKIVTPCVPLPATRMPSTGTRIVWPPLVISMI